MNLKKLLRYLPFNLASTLSAFLIVIITNTRFGSEESPVKTAALFCVIHLAISIYLLFLIFIGGNFQYEFFTYAFLFASVMAIGAMIFDFQANYFAGIVGIGLLSVGLFSRVCLWKYDLEKLEQPQ